MRFIALIVVCILTAAALSSCPANQKRGKSLGPRGSSQSAEPATPKFRSNDLFAGTPLAEDIPDTVSLGYLGDRIGVKLRLKGDDQYGVFKYGLGTSGLIDPEQVLEPGNYGRAFMSIHPTQTWSLIITNYQEEGGPVIDRIMQATAGSVSTIPYEQTPGLIADDRHDALYGLEPFYSWDGKLVIVPLRYTGLCVYDLETGDKKFVKYPPYMATTTGRMIYALPDQNGKRLIFATLWEGGIFINTDINRLFTLDLDNLDAEEPWNLVASLNWLVYSVGSQDFEREPWLIAGSRGRKDNTELTRIPLYARLDPASGQTSLQEFYGEPVWEVVVDPYGEYIAYMDIQRQALVRFNPATGKMDIDGSAYNEEADIMIGPGADPVLAWDKSRLVRAEWSQSEDFPGFGE